MTLSLLKFYFVVSTIQENVRKRQKMRNLEREANAILSQIGREEDLEILNKNIHQESKDDNIVPERLDPDNPDRNFKLVRIKMMAKLFMWFLNVG